MSHCIDGSSHIPCHGNPRRAIERACDGDLFDSFFVSFPRRRTASHKRHQSAAATSGNRHLCYCLPPGVTSSDLFSPSTEREQLHPMTFFFKNFAGLWFSFVCVGCLQSSPSSFIKSSPFIYRFPPFLKPQHAIYIFAPQNLRSPSFLPSFLPQTHSSPFSLSLSLLHSPPLSIYMYLPTYPWPYLCPNRPAYLRVPSSPRLNNS